MKIEQKYHHITDFSALAAVPASCDPLPRASLPIAEIYPMERLTKLIDAIPEPVSDVSVSRASMFFKIPGRGMENDPFLRRLSRLR